MPDKELPPDFAEAMHAHANSDSPRHEWKSQPGFNTVSLGAWLDVCKAAGVEAVPATEIGKIEIESLMFALDDPQSTEENAATTALRTFWAKIEAAKKPGAMLRWDCCTCAEVKHRLDTGRPEWHPDLLDSFYIDDFRASDIIFEYPGTVIAAWSRPWMRARIVECYPVEYRVFVEDDKIVGVSSYYPQRALQDSPEVRDDVAACLLETEKLIASVPTPLTFPALAPRRHSPDRKAFTADFMRLEDGRFLYLEGGPPFGAGAHPCCFEHFDKWANAAAFHLSGVPVALKGAATVNPCIPGAPSTALRCNGTDPTAAATALDTLTRERLLDGLEAIPQSYWPPRPTRQDKAELKARILQALQSRNSARIATAIFQASLLHHWEDELQGTHNWIQRCTRCGAKREKHRQHYRDIWPVWTYL